MVVSVIGLLALQTIAGLVMTAYIDSLHQMSMPAHLTYKMWG